MADDLTFGECPNCSRRIMLKTTAKKHFVYGKCQGFHTDDGSHCGYSFTRGRKESDRIIADAARASRKAPPKPKETPEDEPEETGPEQGTRPESDTAGNDDAAGGILSRARKRNSRA